MEFNAPEVILLIKDVKAIYNMNNIVNPIPDAESLDADLFVGTATERGISRREKLYNICPKDTDTLEDRRFRVKAKENDRIPYTTRALKQKLETLCGKNGYRLSVSHDTVRVKVELTRKSMFEDVREMLEKMIPLNMILDCDLLYNQHLTVRRFTHAQLSKYTHGETRNEVLQ